MTTYTTKYDDTYTITTRIGTYYNEPGDYRIFEAHTEDGDLASEMYTDLTTGQIMQVETEPEYQREGIATALAHFAVDNGFTIFHSPEEHMTLAGARFVARTDFIAEIDPELAYQPD